MFHLQDHDTSVQSDANTPAQIVELARSWRIQVAPSDAVETLMAGQNTIIYNPHAPDAEVCDWLWSGIRICLRERRSAVAVDYGSLLPSTAMA